MQIPTLLTVAVSVLGYNAEQNSTKTNKTNTTIKAAPARSTTNQAIDKPKSYAVTTSTNATSYGNGTEMANPFQVAGIVINDVTTFNATDLEKPEKDVEKAFEKFLNHTGSMFQHSVQNALENKNNTNAVEEFKEEIHLFVDTLAKVENLDAKTMQKIDGIIRSHPEYAAYTRMFVQNNQGLFEKQELDGINMFFTAANDYNPEITDKIIAILNINQKKYHIVPDDFYNKVQLAYAGKS
ncbi:hypothetical protein DSO57_1011095 [Entomophthora muscae]|uniref:Uncharacterized protein n=1 Tax=Entomophthora muscae TaxID=34485 RepID=A0ACC2T6G2_9FUNG|nr:hypothetical protein DSO57_1011095 [Entomophthora muscae]